jgi:outer membrane protein, heavy metal efflux system
MDMNPRHKFRTCLTTAISRRRILLAFCIVLLLANAQPAGAQPSSQLSRYIEEAFAANPGLKALASRVRAAEARALQQTAWDDPVFGFEFMSTPINSINPFRDGSEYDYSLQQMIPFPGKKRSMRVMTEFEARVAGQDAVTRERDLVANITEAYGMMLSAQKRFAIGRENQAQLSRLIESLRARYSTGGESIAEVLRMNVELELARNVEIAIERELRSGAAMLNALRGDTSDTAIPILEDLPLHPPPATADSLAAEAMLNRSEIRAMAFDREMAAAEADMWRRERYPDFMVRAMYKQMRFEMPDSWSLMFGVSIPVAPWSDGKYSGRIDEARAKEQAAEEATADMRNMIAAEVRDAWAKARSLWSQFERTRTLIIPQSEQALRSLLDRYQVARADFASLIDAWRMTNMAKMNAAMLEGEFIGARARMLRAAGRAR